MDKKQTATELQNIRNNLIPFFICVLIPQIIGISAGLITSNSIDSWYSLLNKPSFNPPSSVFGPVWTILYFLMGVSLFLVWKSNRKTKTQLIIFAIQLVANFSWSIAFFNLQSPFFALLIILFLWVLIISMIVEFYKINKISGLIQIPYLLWVSFASVLNYYIYILNK